ncbi:hypothetical protein [Halomarina rubra]|uniref:Transposase n=1 Tax=Halomarina rubra TaxID=2071873 RepID=A0ABD6ARY3_9EURY|nr:hypothetical protein [Halomarina rubra]
MSSNLSGSREYRVTLALKWAYLDHLSVPEIVERFEEEGIGSPAESTVRKYLDEAPKDEVLEQIREEHVDARLQIADREEELFRRARDDEHRATEDVAVKRVVPQTKPVRESDSPVYMTGWEFVKDEVERPEWATEDDVIIRFIDEEVELLAGDQRPLRSFDGSPKYTTEFVGLERDVPELQGRSTARYEQSKHLAAKGEVLGIYEEHINLDASVEESLDEDTVSELRDVFEEIREH